MRLITQDDPVQFRKSMALPDDGQVVLLTTVLVETEWVLRSAFRYNRERVRSSFEALFLLPGVVVAERARVDIELHREGMDFADALHVTGAGECQVFLSFDDALVKRANLSSVELPAAVRRL